MIVFRLSKSRYSQVLSGRGAERSGGRWNSKGVPMVYTGESRALCTAEIAVHLPLGNVPTDYMLITIDIPAPIALQEIDPAALPADWQSFPHPNVTQEIGDHFITQNTFLVLKAPSAVVKGDFNFLLNPLHPDFAKVKIIAVEPFTFDKRLFVR